MHDNEYLSRELIDAGGVAFGVEGIERDKKTRKIKITKKARKRYPTGTTLIVGCTLNTLYTPDEWNMLLKKVGENLPEHDFKEIFVYDEVTGRLLSFFRRAGN